jgi:hypothetical protein
MPISGKTGTTQNWGDAWVVGSSPYYTTAIWFGFDRGGNSLGQAGTGAGLVGPVWGRYMREIHEGLPRRDFVRPATGIVYVTVCARSGNAYCGGTVTLPFMQGTQPWQACDAHGAAPRSTVAAMSNIRSSTFRLDDVAALGSFAMPTLPDDLFDDLDLFFEVPAAAAQNLQPAVLDPAAWTMGNPLLDREDFAAPLIIPVPPAENAPHAHEETAALLDGAADEDDGGEFLGAAETDGGPAAQEAEEMQGLLAMPVGNPLLD